MTGPPTDTKTSRIVSVLFGLFFVALALVIAVVSNASNILGATAAVVLVGVIGLDLIISAVRGKRSLLSRIGPLP